MLKISTSRIPKQWWWNLNQYIIRVSTANYGYENCLAEDPALTCGILGGESRKVNGGGLFGCEPNNGGGDGVKSGRRGGGDGLVSRRPFFPVRDCITPFSFIFSTGFNRERS